MTKSEPLTVVTITPSIECAEISSVVECKEGAVPLPAGGRYYQVRDWEQEYEQITVDDLIKHVKEGAKYQLLRDDDVMRQVKDRVGLDIEWASLTKTKNDILGSWWKKRLSWYKRKIEEINKRLNEITIQVLELQKK